MTFKFPNCSRERILRLSVGATYRAVKARLYTNDVSVTDTSVLSDFTPPSGGYADVTVPYQYQYVTQGDPTKVEFGIDANGATKLPIEFIYTSGVSAHNVYGFVLFWDAEPTATALIGGEKFASAFAIANPADAVYVDHWRWWLRDEYDGGAGGGQFPNAAEALIFNWIGGGWTTGTCRLLLFSNNPTITESSAYASFTWVTTGFTSTQFTLTNAAATLTTNSPTTLEWAEKVFVATAAVGNIYGYAIVTDGTDLLVTAEKFASPYNVTAIGQQITITPRLTLRDAGSY